eukprot:9647568-Alexandrium_andersonii.AAC.1
MRRAATRTAQWRGAVAEQEGHEQADKRRGARAEREKLEKQCSLRGARPTMRPNMSGGHRCRCNWDSCWERLRPL